MKHRNPFYFMSSVFMGNNKSLSALSNIHRLHFSPLFHIISKPFSLTSSPIYFSNSSKPLSYSHPQSKTHEIISSNSHSSVSQFVISEFSHIWKKEAQMGCNRNELQLIIRSGFDLSPEIFRPFLRVNGLKTDDFLKIVLGFGPEIKLREITNLWNLFKWCECQNGDFHHLAKSYELMVSFLTKAHMLDEAKSLLLYMNKENISFSDYNILFCNLIQAYAQASNLENSMVLYDHARNKGLILSHASYNSLIGLLIKLQKTDLVLRVYNDMLNAGLGSYSEKSTLDFVITTLTKRGNLLETMKIIRTLKNLNIIPSQESISAIAEGFCRKKDFGDMMNFLEFWGLIPKTQICNKLIYALCKNLGSVKGWIYVQKLEKLGFKPDNITFGILICESCKGGNVKDALVYLSESYNRDLLPRIYAYNAIISGVFRKGMYRHASYVFDEMLERGLNPNLYTFRVLLAGNCKYRKFDEVEKIIEKTKDFDTISHENGAFFFSKAMSILGLGHLGVKLKRDNGIGFPKAEFFDNLGNGLYLETDLDEFERLLDEILEISMVPDLDLEAINELKKGDLVKALELRDEALQLGQELSLVTISEILRGLCAKPVYVKYVASLLEDPPKLFDQFDSKILNLVLQTLSKNKLAIKARLVLENLVSREMFVERESYTSLLVSFCEEKNILGFKESLKLAKNGNWTPIKTELELIFGFLCNCGAIKETLEFLHYVETQNPELFNVAYKLLIKMLCEKGFAQFACAILEAAINKGLFLDNSSLLYLIKGFINEKKDSEAIGLFEIWYERNKTLKNGTGALILPLLIKFDLIQKSIFLVRENNINNISLNQTLLKELCLKGKLKEAIFVFHELTLENLLLDESCLNALLEGFCQENIYKKALEIFSFMLKKDFNLSICRFSNLVKQICENKQFNRALNLTKLIQGQNKSNEIIYENILIFHLFRMKNELLVERVLTKMGNKCIKPNNVTYDFLIYGFHKCGNVPKLIEAFNASISNGFKPNKRSLKIIMNHFCTKGDLVKALELYNLIKAKWKFGSSIINSLGSKLILSNQHLEAKRICEEAPESSNLDPSIKQFCKIGEIQTAINLVNKMIKSGIVPTSIGYNELVQKLSLNKELDQALDFYTEMRFKKIEPTEKSCETLIQNLCNLGRLSEAKLILEEMISAGTVPSYEMYNLVLEKYHEVKNLEKAAEITREMQKLGYNPKFETQWSIISDLSSFGDKLERDCTPILSSIFSSRG